MLRKIGIMMMALLLTAVVVQAKVFEWGKVSYNVPDAMPNFIAWGPPDQVAPVFRYGNEQNGIMVFAAEKFNPANEDEYVMVLVFIKIRNGQPASYLIAVYHCASIAAIVAGKEKTIIYADRRLLETGKPSFLLEDVPEISSQQWEQFLLTIKTEMIKQEV